MRGLSQDEHWAMGYELWARSRKILDTGELSGEKAYRIKISDQEEVWEENETGGNGKRMRGSVPRKKQFETITYYKMKRGTMTFGRWAVITI